MTWARKLGSDEGEERAGVGGAKRWAAGRGVGGEDNALGIVRSTSRSRCCCYYCIGNRNRVKMGQALADEDEDGDKICINNNRR